MNFSSRNKQLGSARDIALTVRLGPSHRRFSSVLLSVDIQNFDMVVEKDMFVVSQNLRHEWPFQIEG